MICTGFMVHIVYRTENENQSVDVEFPTAMIASDTCAILAQSKDIGAWNFKDCPTGGGVRFDKVSAENEDAVARGCTCGGGIVPSSPLDLDHHLPSFERRLSEGGCRT